MTRRNKPLDADQRRKAAGSAWGVAHAVAKPGARVPQDIGELVRAKADAARKSKP